MEGKSCLRLARPLTMLGLGLLTVSLLAGCESTPPEPPPAPPISVDDVIQLSNSGTSSETIANLGFNRGLAFPMSVDNIMFLRGQRVPDATIDLLLSVERDLASIRQEREYRERPQVSLGLGLGYTHFGGGGYRRGYYGHRR